MKLQEVNLDSLRFSKWRPVAAALPGVSEDDIFRGMWSKVRYDKDGVSFVPTGTYFRGYLFGLALVMGIAWMFASPSLPLSRRLLDAAGVFVVLCLLTPALWRYRRKAEIKVFDRESPAGNPADNRIRIQASNVARLAILDCSPIDFELNWCQLYAITREPEQSHALFQRHSPGREVHELAAQLAARWGVPCSGVDVRPNP